MKFVSCDHCRREFEVPDTFNAHILCEACDTFLSPSTSELQKRVTIINEIRDRLVAVSAIMDEEYVDYKKYKYAKEKVIHFHNGKQEGIAMAHQVILQYMYDIFHAKDKLNIYLSEPRGGMDAAEANQSNDR